MLFPVSRSSASDSSKSQLQIESLPHFVQWRAGFMNASSFGHSAAPARARRIWLMYRSLARPLAGSLDSASMVSLQKQALLPREFGSADLRAACHPSVRPARQKQPEPEQGDCLDLHLSFLSPLGNHEVVRAIPAVACATVVGEPVRVNVSTAQFIQSSNLDLGCRDSTGWQFQHCLTRSAGIGI